MQGLFTHRIFLVTSFLTLLCFGMVSKGFGAAANSRPNIIWIIADDLGYGDLGSYGCRDIPTPHIDSIASQGIRCTNFYAAAPICSPSRASMLTGQYPETHGIGGALMGKGGFRQGTVTIAECLKQSGYATGLVGKWHLGYAGEALPNSRGFEEFYGHRGGKIDFFEHTDTAQKVEGNPMGKHDFFENDTEIFPKGYSTDLFTDRAIRFVENHKSTPFFLVVSYNAPHYSRGGVLQAPENILKRFTKGKKPTDREKYTAMVSCMDDGIGRLMECLSREGLDENTMVIFVSDNGADPKHGGSNGALSAGKWTYREGGIRVPMVAKWPASIPANRTVPDSIHMIDFFPTMLRASGTTFPVKAKIEGVDVMDCLRGEAKVSERVLHFGNTTLMMGKWKLFEDKLYDIENDPTEQKDQAALQPAIFTNLKDHLGRYTSGR